MVSSSIGTNQSAGTISISNIANLIFIKLDRDNYLLWKSQFVPILCTNQLLKYVDGSTSYPNQFLCDKDMKPTTAVNPDYDIWIEQDSLVLLWINVTLIVPVL